jgi:acyl carrier protein
VSDYRAAVQKAAKTLGFVDEHGDLIPLDSFMVVEFVIALEDETGIRIPVATLDEEVFASIDSVSLMLSRR